MSLLKKFPFLLLTMLTGCAVIQNPAYHSGVAALRATASLHKKTIDLGSQEIVYLERDGTGDTILLLHGFASEKDAWIRFAYDLPSGARVLIPDLPGHGQSEPLEGQPYTADVMVGLLRQFVESIDAGDMHIAGNSMGGLYALVYAHRYPDRVLSLTLIDAAGFYPPQPSDLQRSLSQGTNPLIVDEPDDFDRLIAYVFHQPPVLPWPIRPVLRRRYARRSDLNHQIWADFWANRRDHRDTLSATRVPVLVLWGQEDRVLDVTTTDVIRAHKPDAIIEVLPDCGHSPMQEQPRRSARVFRDFIGTL